MLNVLRFLRQNPRITIGFALIGCMLLFWLIGNATIGTSKAVPISAPPDLPPSAHYPLGTDSAGRQPSAGSLARPPTKPPPDVPPWRGPTGERADWWWYEPFQPQPPPTTDN